jgi:hypothetical protein
MYNITIIITTTHRRLLLWYGGCNFRDHGGLLARPLFLAVLGRHRMILFLLLHIHVIIHVVASSSRRHIQLGILRQRPEIIWCQRMLIGHDHGVQMPMGRSLVLGSSRGWWWRRRRSVVPGCGGSGGGMSGSMSGSP